MGKKNRTPNHKNVIDLVDWLRANHNRINAANMTRDAVSELASKELGFEYSWTTIGRTAKQAGVTLQLRLPQYGRSMKGNGRIDETLGQMAVMLHGIATLVDAQTLPLVQLASDQYLEQKGKQDDEARHQS